MGDIDFDELDKAVNSLMGKDAALDDTDDQPKQKTLSINTTLKPGDNPAFDKLEEVAKKIGSDALVAEGEVTRIEELDAPAVAAPGSIVTPDEPNVNETIASAPSPAVPPSVPPVPAPVPVTVATPAPKRPSSGRFMDVVHPSSDMKTAAGAPSLSVPERPKVETARPEVAKPTTAPVRTAVEPVLSPVALPAPTVPAVAPELADESKPLTPFLPDAKVEKRPLGGGPSSVPGVLEDSGDYQASSSDVNPAEAKALEIAEIESIGSEGEKIAEDGDGQRPLDPKDFIDKPSAVDQQLSSIESAEITESAPASVTSESVRAVESGDTEKVLVAVNANQEQAASADSSGGIFDVQNHPQLLGHPTKQKSGWGRVILIVLIIVVCAVAAGAAYYLLGMNQ